MSSLAPPSPAFLECGGYSPSGQRHQSITRHVIFTPRRARRAGWSLECGAARGLPAAAAAPRDAQFWADLDVEVDRDGEARVQICGVFLPTTESPSCGAGPTSPTSSACAERREDAAGAVGCCGDGPRHGAPTHVVVLYKPRPTAPLRAWTSLVARDIAIGAPIWHFLLREGGGGARVRFLGRTCDSAPPGGLQPARPLKCASTPPPAKALTCRR